MAQKRYSFDEDKIDRFQKEGRGEETGASYKPWLTIQDVPSMGRSHRLRGWKTGRVHHLLSDIEFGLFYLFDWSESVHDIRERLLGCAPGLQERREVGTAPQLGDA